LATNDVLALLYGLMNFLHIYILYRCHPEKSPSDGSEMVVGHDAAWEPLNYVDLTCAVHHAAYTSMTIIISIVTIS